MTSRTNATERDASIAAGYTLEGTAAFVYTTQVCSSTPLFRLFNAAEVDHFYTSALRCAFQSFSFFSLLKFPLPEIEPIKCA